MRITVELTSLFSVPMAGFPIPKLDMLSQLEGGEEQWVPDPQDLEERDILRVTYTGNDTEQTLDHGLYPFRVSTLHVPRIPSLSQRVIVLKSLEVFFFKNNKEWFRVKALKPDFINLNPGPYLWNPGKIINLSLGSSSINYYEI